MSGLFEVEEKVITDAERRIESGEFQGDDARQVFESLTKEYKKLYKTTRRIMRLSDRNERELQRLNQVAERAASTLSRYFSPNLANAITRDRDFSEQSGERRDLTFLFTDLAGFTTLVEQLDPKTIVRVLNEYLDNLTQIVYRHGGTTEKIVGDAVHVIFGAPEEQSDQEHRALACALAIDEFAEQFRLNLNANGIGLGSTRIGIHAGPAMLGNFGGKIFFDYTAHGDAINTAARLENANRFLGTRICASDAVVNCCSQSFVTRPIGSLLLAGKTESIAVHELLPDSAKGSDWLAAYHSAWQMVADGRDEARQAFAALVSNRVDDPLAVFHLVRLLAGETGIEIVLPKA